MNKKLSVEFYAKLSEEGNICDLLQQKTSLSKLKIKEALIRGACRVKKKTSKTTKRVRKAKTEISEGDLVSFHYDPDIISLALPAPKLIRDLSRYTVWFKPAGMLSQGSQFADHCAMTRLAELFFNNNRQVFLVHRLDREASGVFLLAHDKKTAAQLSGLFQNRLVKKKYLVEVLGNIAKYRLGPAGIITSPLDGKSAETSYSLLSYSSTGNSSRLIVTISSGRLHQIRRHMNSIGHPVLGDPRYGVGNKNTEGMRLCAASLSFVCPVSGKKEEYRVDCF